MEKESYKIINPDHVELEFQLAGIGSRFCAGVLDVIFMSLILLVMILALIPYSDIDNFFVEPTSFSSSIQGGLIILATFIVSWGYHVFWETVFHGQSPGKKICGIQVLTDDGLLPSLKQAAIRNLIRLIDSFPGVTYFVAAVTMGIDPLGKRFGDMASGTIVVRRELKQIEKNRSLSARSMVQIERGGKAEPLNLPFGSVDPSTLALIQRFLIRRKSLSAGKREEIASTIAAPLYEKWGDSSDKPEALLEKIHQLAVEEASKVVQDQVTKEKLELWKTFEKQATRFIDSKRRLRKLAADEMESFIRSYRQVIADLSRARSTKADRSTVTYLNCLAILGHQLLHAYSAEEEEEKDPFFYRYPTLIRKTVGPVALSAMLFFIPALITYFAVLAYPEIGYDLVPEQFLDFSPAKADNIHNIPSVTRSIVASGIITNNIQVTFLAFALGITAGIGTCYILIFNGVHLGSVIAWMQIHGNSYAIWGWIMPHGATEILAIILSGGAGFVLANAILRPGRLGCREALKKAAKKAVSIEFGCMGMLLIAGLIEGFVSPSSITYIPRLMIFSVSILLWGVYFLFCKGKSFKNIKITR